MESKTIIDRAQVAQELAALDKEFADFKINLVTEHTEMVVEFQAIDKTLKDAKLSVGDMARALVSLATLRSRLWRARDMIKSFSAILEWTGMAKTEDGGAHEESEADLSTKATARVLLESLGEEEDDRIDVGGGNGE